MFENANVTGKLMPATILIDGKFTLQLFVSIQPAEELAVRRRTVLTNGRRTNRKEIPNNVKERLGGNDTIVRTQVANKNRTENEGRVKTTTLPKNRFIRLSTTTSRYLPTSKSSEEEDSLPWESWKTKNVTVKGSIQQASNRTTSIPIPRPRLSRIRTTPAHSSKDDRRSHFVVEQRHGNFPKKPRGGQNQDQDPTAVNDTMQLQEDNKDADAIDWRIAASRNVKTEQVQTDGARSKQKGGFSEEPQAEVPIFKHSVVGRGSAFDQTTPATEIVSTSTATVALKLPLPLNRRKPIARESQASDVTADSERQVSHAMVTMQNEARKKQIVRVREMVSDRVSTVKVRTPSWSDSEEHEVFWVRYVDEEDDFPLEHERIINPIDLKKEVVYEEVVQYYRIY